VSNFSRRNLYKKQLYFSENALKLTYRNVEFQNFPGYCRALALRGGEGNEGKSMGGNSEDDEEGKGMIEVERHGVKGKRLRIGNG
jgi:hypothetical protein